MLYCYYSGRAMPDENKFTTTRTGHLTNSSSLKRRLLTSHQQPRSESSTTASTSRDLIDVPARRDHHAEYPDTFLAVQTKSLTSKTFSSSGASYEEGHERGTLSRDRLNSLLSRYLQTDSFDSFPSRYNWESGLIAHKPRLENGNTSRGYSNEKPRDSYAKNTHIMTLNSPERKSHIAFCHSGAASNNLSDNNRISSLSMNRNDVGGSAPSLRHRTAHNGYIPDPETSDADCRCGTLMRWNFRRRDNSDRHLADTPPDSHAHLRGSMSVKASGNHSNRSKSGFIDLEKSGRTDDVQWITGWRHGSSGINDWRSTTLPRRSDGNVRLRLTPSNSWGNCNKAKRIPMSGSLDRHRLLNNHSSRGFHMPPPGKQTVHKDAWSIATPNSTLRVRSSRSKTEKLRITADATQNFTNNKKWKMLQLNPSDRIASPLSGTPNSRNGFHTWPRRMGSRDDEEVMWLVPIGPGIQVLEPESIVRRLQMANKSSSNTPSKRVPRRERLLGTTDCVTSSVPSCKNIEAPVLKEMFMRKNTSVLRANSEAR